MCGSWWEGKLRLQNKKAVHVLPGLQCLHIFIPFLPYAFKRSLSIGSYTNILALE